ncbi:MAG: histidine kinase dimerization/phosphoacceptor domain-containing protein, partial [Verrucomicrobia bacterium]|nr:histidine kinase dimerization/phosphoacceptor domain-containing protein [Verrucomicrobiota bacterium]
MNKHVFMGVVIGIYTALFIATFDRWPNSVLISTVALIGLFGWFYGTRIGLLSIVPFILLNTAILFLVSGDPYDILLTYNPTGIILSMVTVLSAGFMRESQNKLNQLEASLSKRVDDATAELGKLTRQLIDYDENERITMGQDLHDGVGQYLTGMLLHSEALSFKLREAQHSEADLAERMTQRIRNSMLFI